MVANAIIFYYYKHKGVFIYIKKQRKSGTEVLSFYSLLTYWYWRCSTPPPLSLSILQISGLRGSKVGIVLTAMSVATVLFRPMAGYLLDNFKRYRVYLLFLAMFNLSFPAFIILPVFGLLILVRLYMGAVYSVCASATMTMAGDVLPVAKITEGISRFAFTMSIGMAVGPYAGLQVQSNMSSKASFLTIFGITVAALICVSCCRLKYPKVQRKNFSIKESLYSPALPFMLNMMFLMIPYGCLLYTSGEDAPSLTGEMSNPGLAVKNILYIQFANEVIYFVESDFTFGEVVTNLGLDSSKVFTFAASDGFEWPAVDAEDVEKAEVKCPATTGSSVNVFFYSMGDQGADLRDCVSVSIQ